jgi:predicted phosphoribosyltransferase
MDTGEDLRGKTVILVDDGMTPASKLIAGAAAVRLRGAAELVFAVPVFSLACRRLRGIVEEIAVIDDPEVSFGVGQLYGDCLGKSGEVSSYSA